MRKRNRGTAIRSTDWIAELTELPGWRPAALGQAWADPCLVVTHGVGKGASSGGGNRHAAAPIMCHKVGDARPAVTLLALRNQTLLAGLGKAPTSFLTAGRPAARGPVYEAWVGDPSIYTGIS